MEKIEIMNLLKHSLDMPVEYSLSDEEISALRKLTTDVVPYFIAFTARSGSTFLTYEVSAAHVLSHPAEWFNYDDLKESKWKGQFAFSDYFKKILKDNLSPNGVFGCEINWLQLKALSALAEPQALFHNKIRWFYLRRKNLIAQAISNFIADQTGVFHSYQVSDASTERLVNLNYDSDRIKEMVIDFIAQEKYFDRWFHDINVKPVNIFYEDIIHSPSYAVMLFANVLGVSLPKGFEKTSDGNPIKKVGGEKNLLFESRFRCEEVEFIKEHLLARASVLTDIPQVACSLR
jgi:LPS sulfotransferase NodH